MIYRGFITANSPRTAATDAGEKLVGRKRKEEREREREEYAPRPRLLIFYASHLMTLVREGPFELGPKRPVRRRRGAFSGTLFPPFCSLECVNPEARLAFGARYICRRFNSGITSRSFSEQREYEESR